MGETRINKWDNIKFNMILCVVVGHMIYLFQDNSITAQGIYLFIYSFHMPVFIFLAGMFSKSSIRKKKTERIVQFLFIYIVMKLLETIASYTVSGKISFHFLWEDGPAWFALAIAVFLAVTMLVVDYDWKSIMAFAILIGCVAGLDTHFGDHFASMRICVFYPVFLAGYYVDRHKFELKSKSEKFLSRIVSYMIMAIVFLIFMMRTEQLYPLLKLFKGKYEYAEMDMGMDGLFFRLGCYALWAVLICAVILIGADGKRIFTWLGKRSMAIFIWHGLFVTLIMRTFKVKSLILTELPHTYLICAICIAIGITVICAYLPEFRIFQRKIKG